MTPHGPAGIVTAMRTTCESHPHRPPRRGLGVLMTLLLAVGLVTVTASTAGAQSNTFQVVAGGSVQVCTTCQGGGSVSPSSAGTVTAGPTNSSVFTASPGFSGTATITATSYEMGTGQYTLVTFTVIVLPGNTATANGSFTPVAAPGPCLVITVNSIVDFGNVELGGGWSPVPPAVPNIAGCTQSQVTQDVLVQATDAQNGLGSLDVDGCAPPSTYLTCDPAVGSFAVGVANRSLVVGSTPGVLHDDLDGDFATRTVDLTVSMPPSLPAGSTGTLFAFDVILTAVAA